MTSCRGNMVNLFKRIENDYENPVWDFRRSKNSWWTRSIGQFQQFCKRFRLPRVNPTVPGCGKSQTWWTSGWATSGDRKWLQSISKKNQFNQRGPEIKDAQGWSGSWYCSKQPVVNFLVDIPGRLINFLANPLTWVVKFTNDFIKLGDLINSLESVAQGRSPPGFIATLGISNCWGLWHLDGHHHGSSLPWGFPASMANACIDLRL